MRGEGHGQRHDEQAGQGYADEDGAHYHAPDVENKNGRRADADQDDGVDDPLDDHRAESRAAADTFAIAQIVASHQLAEAGRQDVVGQVSDEHVAAQPSQRHGVDRGDEALPAQCSEDQIEADADDRKTKPGQLGAAHDAGRLAEVDTAQREIDADE